MNYILKLEVLEDIYKDLDKNMVLNRNIRKFDVYDYNSKTTSKRELNKYELLFPDFLKNVKN